MAGNADWTSCDARNPCRICEGTSWCQESKDKRRVMCRRHAEGALKTDTDANGATYYIHRHPDCPDDPGTQQVLPTPDSSNRAPPELLDKVYSALLGTLPLDRRHAQDLRKRGLTDAEAAQLRYLTLLSRNRASRASGLLRKFGNDVVRVPGLIIKTNDKGERYLTVGGKPGLLIPVRDLQGRIVALQVRADGATGESKYTYLSSTRHGGPGPGSPIHVPASTPKPCEVVRVTEGTLKADIATLRSGIPTLGLPGIGNWRGLLPVLEALGVKRVLFAPDADARTNHNVAQAVQKCHAGLIEAGYTVDVETWDAKRGKGIDDLLAAGGTPRVLTGDAVTAFLAELPESPTAQPNAEPTTDRAEITLGADEFRVNTAVCVAMANDDALFRRGGTLVRVIHNSTKNDGIDRADGGPRISDAPLAWLRDRITRQVKFRQVKGDEVVDAHPPEWAVKAFAANGDWLGIRHLTGIVTAPTLRADGSILTTAGYDPTTGLLLDLREDFPSLPQTLTQDDAKRAVAILLDVLADFPFDRPEHRAAAVAFILTPLARYAFTGPSPLFLVDANVRGSGKTLLCDVAGLIATGRGLARMSNPATDEEADKRLLAIAIAGDPVVLIDNITGALGCGSLDAALTGTTYRGRILGRTEIVEVPLLATWCASGNNVMLAADTSRRVLHVRLRSNEENPELRTGFRYADLRQHVRAHRGELLAAGLTILAAYIRAGQPSQGLSPWGSFEAWSDLVRNAVVWCGLPDPGETRQELVSQSDTTAQALGQLLESWREIDPDGRGLTAGELLDTLARHRLDYEGVREAVLELCGGTPDKLPTVRTVGNRFRHLRGRVIGGKYLDGQPNRIRQIVWTVSATRDLQSLQSVAESISLTPTRVNSINSIPPVHENGARPHIGAGKLTLQDSADSAPPTQNHVATDARTSPAECLNRPDMPRLPPWVSPQGDTQ